MSRRVPALWSNTHASWRRAHRIFLRCAGFAYLFTMALCAVYVVWCVVFAGCSDWRPWFGAFLLVIILAPLTAIVGVWSAGLDRSQKWELTHRLTIGFGAIEATYRYLLTGGTRSKR